MVDLQNSSADGAAAMGIFAQHDKDMGYPPGYTEKIVRDVYATGTAYGYNSDADTMGILTGDTKPVWDWYWDDVGGSADKWKQAVAQYEHIDPSGQKVDLPPFDPNGSYTPNPGSGFTPPDDIKPFSGEGKGSVSFAADAINYFIKNINIVAPDGGGMLLDSANKFVGIGPGLKPGLFAKAEQLRTRMAGTSGDDGGLVGTTTGVLQAVHQALYDLGQDLATVLKTYKSTDDLTKMTADDFGKDIDSTAGQIQALGGMGGDSSQNSNLGTGSGGGSSSGGSGSGGSGSGSSGTGK